MAMESSQAQLLELVRDEFRELRKFLEAEFQRAEQTAPRSRRGSDWSAFAHGGPLFSPTSRADSDEDEESEEKDSVNRVAAGGLIQEGSLTQEGVQRTVQKRGSIRRSFVRKAMVEQQAKAEKEATRLASIKLSFSPAQEPSSQLTSILRSVVSSSSFTSVIMLMILLNIALLGIEVDMAAHGHEVPEWFTTMNMLIVLVFTLEVILKWVAFGCHEFWFGPDSRWNIFDAAIIAIALVETAIDIWAQVMSNMATATHLRVMRSVRLFRALRGVRVIRLFRYISALRTLVLCIISTMASLVWTLVLLILLFYTFGVVLTQLVTDTCRDPEISQDACPAQLQLYWRSVPDSMLTLFMAISGGISWEDALRPLQRVSPLAVTLMILYIVTTVLAVLNVVTGVFCNTAIESAHADKEVAAITQIRKQANQVQHLKSIFTEIDTANCNMVSLQDFQEALAQQKMSSFLQSMGISTEDVLTLFLIMDADHSGFIDLEEFVSGCMTLCGPAKSLQFAMMSYENKLTRQAIKRLSQQTAALEPKSRKLNGHAVKL